MLGAIFFKAQNKIQDPAKLSRLVQLIDAENWISLDADTKGDLYEGLLLRPDYNDKRLMTNQFTQKAEQQWQAMSEVDKQTILSSVWCSHCRQGTTITDYSCISTSNSLLLEGKCQVCGEMVRRMVD